MNTTKMAIIDQMKLLMNHLPKDADNELFESTQDMIDDMLTESDVYSYEQLLDCTDVEDTVYTIRQMAVVEVFINADEDAIWGDAADKKSIEDVMEAYNQQYKNIDSLFDADLYGIDTIRYRAAAELFNTFTTVVNDNMNSDPTAQDITVMSLQFSRFQLDIPFNGPTVECLQSFLDDLAMID